MSSVYRELDESVRAHLADIARCALKEDDGRVAELAREEVPKLVAAVRTLLAEHQPDANGNCPACRRGSFLRRRTTAPCRAYLAAHLCLMSTEDSDMKNLGDKDNAGLRTAGRFQ